MTLYRQLLTFSCLVLICLCAGMWVGELTRTRHFLSEQLESHAQDTATSLGLSLSTLTDGKDIPTMESMVSALFDRGYYRCIQLRDIDDHLLVDRSATIKVEGVPSWFVRLLPLNTPQAKALIMHGWQQTGTVLVVSHPGYAYQTLWRSGLAASLSFIAAFFAVALLGGWGLRRLLRPLTGIEEQAVALTERRFPIQHHLPRTRELRRVVLAMNRMAERVRDMFHEQAAIADELMQRAYQDPLTGLGNRRFLEAQTQAKISTKNSAVHGALLLVQVQGLQQLNQNHGYEAGDELIRRIADILRQACSAIAEPIITRLGGGDFALLLPNTEKDEAQLLGDFIVRSHNETADSSQAAVFCGGTIYASAAPLGTLLAAADQALATARHKNEQQAVLIAAESARISAPTGRLEWKALLDNMLHHRTIALYSQPTVSQSDLREILHHEILTRWIDAEGNHQSLGILLPFAEQLGLLPALDRLILEQLHQIPLQEVYPQRIAVNLSPLSLSDPDFMAWLPGWLDQSAGLGLALNFEFPEYQAVRYRETIMEFAARIKPAGHKIGVDHFGQGLIHFGYLKSLLPDYVKIDRAITQDLWNEQSDSVFFINTLCTVAHSLDIRVIVEGVETEKQWLALSKIHLDAVQGFLIQRPAPLQG